MVDTRTKSGKAAFAAALTAVVIGACVLIGWLINSESLKRIVADFIAMNPASAVAFIFGGASIALFLLPPGGSGQKSRGIMLAGRLCALVVACIGLARLSSVLGGWDIGIDRWFFTAKLGEDPRFPNSMAPNAAFDFFLLGGALLFVDAEKSFVRFCVKFSAAFVGLGSLLAILGYIYDIQSLYHFGTFVPMALHTAIAFSVLIVAFFLSQTDRGLLAVFAGNSDGAKMARRILPAAILVPATLGWLAQQGEKAGIYSAGFGEALQTVGNIVTLTFLICSSVLALRRADLARLKAEHTMRKSEERLGQLAENISEVFWITSHDMREVYYFSPAYERVWGRSVARLAEHPRDWSDAILPEDYDRVFATFGRLIAGEPSVSVEFRIARAGGETRWIHSRGFQVRNAAEKVIRLAGIASDITDRKRIETQMIQSQRLETVGKLAGGVAHEFNSILTIIIGQSELLLNALPPGDDLQGNATSIRTAAERAASLTRQLLAYGRKQFLRPESIDLNSVLGDMESTLRHLMGQNVDLRIVPASERMNVKIDPNQIEQVIVNIAMNAAAVMPTGGKLTLETSRVTLGQEYVSDHHDLKVGEYVMLAISDTGGGMSEETKKRIFEPFFSTQDIGQGIGLGLATCYGIIKQSGGHITVYSELSRGTTFKIYLPQVEVAAKIPAPRLAAPDLPPGTETILLVEDDAVMSKMAVTLLKRLGYTVLTAANGLEALRLDLPQNIEAIDLLFTDLIMPHMTGKELADRVKVLHPRVKILFTSAYTENSIVHQGALEKGAAILQKPYTPSALAHKLREVLDSPNTPLPAAVLNTLALTRS